MHVKFLIFERYGGSDNLQIALPIKQILKVRKECLLQFNFNKNNMNDPAIIAEKKYRNVSENINVYKLQHTSLKTYCDFS